MGVTWLGGNILLYLAIWPALLKMPATEGKRYYGLVTQRVGTLLGACGVLAVLFGIVLGVVFGPISSFDKLIEPYGLTWLAALVIALSTAFWGDRTNRVIEPLWDGDKVRVNAQSRLRIYTIVELIGLGAVLACMVAMHYGY
jgi:uncharacterized membrane protein